MSGNLNEIESSLDSINSNINDIKILLISGELKDSEDLLVQQGLYNNSHQSILLLSCILIVLFISVLSSFLPKRKGVLKK